MYTYISSLVRTYLLRERILIVSENSKLEFTYAPTQNDAWITVELSITEQSFAQNSNLLRMDEFHLR